MPWMTDLFYDPQLDQDVRGAFADRPLHEICMPGTHDSGCYANYMLSLNILSRTQTMNVAAQLAGGIRYFDIRPCFYGQQIYTYHGPLFYGDRIDGDEGILAQVRNFMESLAPTDAELVILNVAHFYKFNQERHEALIGAIIEKLGNFLVPDNQGGVDLFNSRYRRLLTGQDGTRSRVAIIYDGALDENREPYITTRLQRDGYLPTGFFTVSPKYVIPEGQRIYLFDIYSNKTAVDDTWLYGTGMRPDQRRKLDHRSEFPYTTKPWGNELAPNQWSDDAPRGVNGTLHVLSWTLTPQRLLGEPISYAKEYANPALLGFLAAKEWAGAAGQPGYYDALYNPQINIVYVDAFESVVHANPGSPWHGMAQPVAIAARINVGPVGPGNTW